MDGRALTDQDVEQQCSLPCRDCGCRQFRVIYTRPTWGGRIMRRPECWQRSGRMTTRETARA